MHCYWHFKDIRFSTDGTQFSDADPINAVSQMKLFIAALPATSATGAVWAAAGSRAQGPGGLRNRPGHEQLLGSLAADRGERLSRVLGGRVIVRHAGEVVADHALCGGRRQRIVERAHLAGVVGADAPVRSAPADIVAPSALLRPLAEYEALVGGSW